MYIKTIKCNLNRPTHLLVIDSFKGEIDFKRWLRLVVRLVLYLLV